MMRSITSGKDGFWEKGVQLQFQSQNMEEALANYTKCCTRCSMCCECSGRQCSIERAFWHNRNKYKEEWKNNPDLRQRVEWALEMG